MPKTTFTNEPLRTNAKDHPDLELHEFYDWEILSTDERVASTGTEILEALCQESNTEAVCRLTIFFSPNTAPQVSRWLTSMGIERSIGQEVDVNEELIKGKRFSAKMKAGKSFVPKGEEEPVTPWEIDGFSCRKPEKAASSSPSPATAKPASKAAATEEGW